MSTITILHIKPASLIIHPPPILKQPQLQLVKPATWNVDSGQHHTKKLVLKKKVTVFFAQVSEQKN